MVRWVGVRRRDASFSLDTLGLPTQLPFRISSPHFGRFFFSASYLLGTAFALAPRGRRVFRAPPLVSLGTREPSRDLAFSLRPATDSSSFRSLTLMTHSSIDQFNWHVPSPRSESLWRPRRTFKLGRIPLHTKWALWSAWRRDHISIIRLLKVPCAFRECISQYSLISKSI